MYCASRQLTDVKPREYIKGLDLFSGFTSVSIVIGVETWKKNYYKLNCGLVI